MSWLIETEVVPRESKRAEAADFYTAVMKELTKLDVFDPGIHGELRRGPIYIAVAVATDDVNEAIGRGISAIRCAIHAAGGSTHTWPLIKDVPELEMGEDGEWVVNFSGMSQKPLDAELVG